MTPWHKSHLLSVGLHVSYMIFTPAVPTDSRASLAENRAKADARHNYRPKPRHMPQLLTESYVDRPVWSIPMCGCDYSAHLLGVKIRMETTYKWPWLGTEPGHRSGATEGHIIKRCKKSTRNAIIQDREKERETGWKGE